MNKSNPWIGYTDRSYEQIKDKVITEKMPVYVPEITDHTEHETMVKMVEVHAGIADMLGYYIDRKAEEVFLSTQKKFENAVKYAKVFDYRIKGAVAAKVDCRFYIVAPAATDIVIPVGTRIGTIDGIQFLTDAEATIFAGETEVNVGCTQWVLYTDEVVGNSTGQINQLVPLVADVVDKSVSVVVNGNGFTEEETLAYSNGTDKVFRASLNEQGIIELSFGDNINGAVPEAGQDIIADYATSAGALGNVSENTITEVIDPVVVPPGFTLKVNNPNRASGGTDAEDLAKLKRNIPLSLRTLLRAVTRQDYEDIAMLAPGVAKAGVLFECGKTVDVYIAPEGGGIASSSLLASTKMFFEDKRMVTTQVDILPAGEVRVQLEADIFVLPSFLKSNVETAVKAALMEYFSVDNQDISGNVQVGNIYQEMENTRGVDYSRLKQLTPIPYARVVAGESALNWDRSLNVGSVDTVKWKVSFISPTVYELTRSNQFIGTFSIGDALQLVELNFKINPSVDYEVGDGWEFYTYNYNGSISLSEPSVLLAYANNIKLNMYGGL